MSKVTYIADKLVNLVANLGTSRDKTAHSSFDSVTTDDLQLINAYRGSWMARKIVDIPAEDACRRWRDWQAESSDITKIEALEKRLDVRGKVLEAMRKARLFGGAAVYISTNETADLSKPMRPTEQIRSLTVLTRRYLTASELDLDPNSKYFYQPKYYTLANTSQRIHPSRLIRFVGHPLPDEELQSGIEYGWGDSVLTSLIEDVKRADSTLGNVASLVFEAKVDVVKIPQLMTRLQDKEFEKALLERLRLAAMAKGINGMLMLDSEEEYEQKSANFSSLRDLMDSFLQVVSGAADIPVTRFLGTSPTGLNSTGESDLRNYYDSVSSDQELIVRPAMSDFDDLLIRNALGTENVEDVWYTWSSLWQSSDKEKSETGKNIADTIQTLSDTELFPPEALSAASVTMLTERGVLTGLEQAMKEFSFTASREEEEFEEEPGSLIGDSRTVLTDATPRTLYVARRVINTEDIREWAQVNGLPELNGDLHVTVVHSTKELNWMKLGRDWSESENGILRIPAGGPRTIELFGDNSIVLEFACESLTWRHESALRAGASWDWDEYRPHITLFKTSDGLFNPNSVEPYRGPIVLGPEIFEEIKDD